MEEGGEGSWRVDWKSFGEGEEGGEGEGETLRDAFDFRDLMIFPSNKRLVEEVHRFRLSGR